MAGLAERTVLIASAGLLYLALFALAAAQPQNGDVLTGRRLAVSRRQQARLTGWTLLAASLAIAVIGPAPVTATLTWIGTLPAVGLPLVLARTYRPRLARSGVTLALIAVIGGLLLAGWG